VLHKGDFLLRVLLFWAIFLPLDAKGSIRSGRKLEGEHSTHSILSLGSIGLFLQIALIYWTTFFLKAKADVWQTGYALFVTLNIDAYVTPFGLYLLNFPRLLTLLTYLTLVIEGIGPIMLFFPFRNGPMRTAVVFLFLGFHFILMFCLSVGLFQPIMMIGLLAFLPSWFWDQIKKVMPKNFLGRKFLAWFFSPIQKTHSDPEKSKTAKLKNPWFLDAFGGLCLVYIFLANFLYVAGLPLKQPKILANFASVFYLEQKWGMFTEVNKIHSGWFMVLGKLPDGKFVDVLKGGREVKLDKPEVFSKTYINHNWRIFWSHMTYTDLAVFRPYLAQYLCQKWDAGHDEKLNELAIYQVHEKTLPHYEIEKPKPRKLIHYSCQKK